MPAADGSCCRSAWAGRASPWLGRPAAHGGRRRVRGGVLTEEAVQADGIGTWKRDCSLRGSEAIAVRREYRHLGDVIEAAGGEYLLDTRVRSGGSHHQEFVVPCHPGPAPSQLSWRCGLAGTWRAFTSSRHGLSLAGAGTGRRPAGAASRELMRMSAGAPPDQAGDRAEGDGRQVGDGPVEQNGRGHLRAGPVAGAGCQDGDQAEFGDPETARGDGSTVSSRTNAKAAHGRRAARRARCAAGGRIRLSRR